MSHYAISISTDALDQEYHVVLRGPGIDLDGRSYVFATSPRALAFAETVNFAYEQGLLDGMRRAPREDGRLLVVTGTTPDNMVIGPEGWWAQLRRRCSRYSRRP